MFRWALIFLVFLILVVSCNQESNPPSVPIQYLDGPDSLAMENSAGPSLENGGEQEIFDPRTHGRIWVQVLREEDGQPMEGVGVHLYWHRGDEESGRYNTLTHEQGKARIPVPPRTFATHLDIDGTPFTAPVSLSINAIIEMGDNPPMVVRVKPAGILAGVVHDLEGIPVAGAALSLWSKDRWKTEDLKILTPTSRGSSDGNGVFRVGGLPGGPFTISAEAPGMVCVQRAGGVVHFGQTHEGIELLMAPAHEVFGEIYGSDGQPLADAVVVAGPPGRRADLKETENEQVYYYPAAQIIKKAELDGTFLLDLVPDGSTWNLSLRHEKHLSWYGRIEADQPVVRMDMEPGQILRGMVSGPDNKPLKQVMVRVVGKVKKKSKTRRKGDFGFVGLPIDPDAVLLFYSPGYAATGAWNLDPGTPLEIQMEKGQVLEGKLSHADGSAGAGLRFMVRRDFSEADAAAFFALPTPEEEFGLNEGVTDEDGNFRLHDLASVPFLLHVEGPDGDWSAEVVPGKEAYLLSLPF
jgi:hypothetical protein